QIGATILHRTLVRLFSERGIKIDRTYQLNTGGNTDFLNMLERSRLKSKKISKTQSVQSQLPVPLEPENIHIGPSDYVPWQNDNKVCFIRIEGRKFGNVPVELELRLSVEDSPNSAGIVIDAIRCAKIALDRGIGGPLIAASAYFMKSPPKQYPDWLARQMLEDFIGNEKA
ncbi:MAG: inositol-3-phosphate synthase, partial [Candidatus Aenigmatarchaeota archaeon]